MHVNNNRIYELKLNYCLPSHEFAPYTAKAVKRCNYRSPATTLPSYHPLLADQGQQTIIHIRIATYARNLLKTSSSTNFSFKRRASLSQSFGLQS